MLYHVYRLTGSTLQVGLIGAAQGLTVLFFSPLAGHYADRIDRKKLLQSSQLIMAVAAVILAIVSFSGYVRAWHIILAAAVLASMMAFERALRQAIIPAIVPRDEMVQGLALMNASREVSRLVGPASGGALVAIGGPGFMYILAAAMFVCLIVILLMLHLPPMSSMDESVRIWDSMREAVGFVKKRRIIAILLSLDISMMVFAMYEVILPALALDVLGVGAVGYGFLAGAPPIGAMIGGVVVYRLSTYSSPAGRVVLVMTAAYGLSAASLAQSRTFWMAMLAAIGLGAADAISTTMRHAVVLLETPDRLRGRVSALYGIAAQGGPALGNLNIGWLSGVIGPVLALTIGGFVPVLYVGAVALTSRTARDYRISQELNED